jgi:hypothetical protein
MASNSSFLKMHKNEMKIRGIGKGPEFEID